jgi:exodeoxyribonuclease VII small subunit
MAKAKNPQDFESAIKELEKIINNMESGKLPLSDSLSHFEQGVKLTNHCQELLSNAQQKIEILVNEHQNKFQDFAVDDLEETDEL